MSRYLRYLLTWLSCTAVSVGAVLLTVHFVVGSTKPKPPVARSVPTVLGTATTHPNGGWGSPEPSPSAPSPSVSSSAPASRAPKPASAMPRATVTVTVTPTTDAAEESTLCELGGVGVQHFRTDGGKATIRFGERGVCLMSAVPNEGFTVKTVQTDPAELTVIFLSDQHESEINAKALPENQASVVESPH